MKPNSSRRGGSKSPPTFPIAWKSRCGFGITLLLALIALSASPTAQVSAASPAKSAGPTASQPTPPQRIAILDFDYSATKSSVQTLFGFDADVGKGIADQLARELMKSVAYSVVDPAAVEKILAEQKLSMSGRSDRESAVKVGKALGADAVVMGAVIQFGGTPRKIGDEEWIPHKRKATVEAEARLVDVATDEIVAVASGRGVASSSNASLLAGWHGSADTVDFGRSDFQQTAMGQAMNAAVTQMAATLAADSGRLVSGKDKN